MTDDTNNPDLRQATISLTIIIALGAIAIGLLTVWP